MRSGVARGVSIAVLTVASPAAAVAAPSIALRAAALVAGLPWTTTGDGVGGAQLGASLAGGDLDGDGHADLVVGASRLDTAVNPGAGKAYVFLGSGSGLSAMPVWSTEGLDYFSLLGTSTAVADFDGDGYADLAVGAPWYGAYAGEVYVYRWSATGPGAEAPWKASGGTLQALGESIAAADVNGDGYADLLVGVPGALTTSAAGVRLYLGSAKGLAPAPAWTATGDGQAGSRLGEAVAAGDLDGDGFADVAVSAPAASTGQAGGGEVFVYYGAAGGPGASADWTFEGDGSGGGIGAHHGLAMGDVDGDGFLDLVVGASGYDPAPSAVDAGRVWVFLGGPGGLGTTPAWVSSGDGQAGAAFGDAVAAADLDGDGYAEVIAGAPLEDALAAGGTLVADAGTVRVFRGSPAGPLGLPGLVLAGDPELAQPGAGLGAAVAAVGDVDGDGIGDLAVGAPLYDVGAAVDAGRVWVFAGPEVMSCSSDGSCSPPDVYALSEAGCSAAADCDDGDPCSLDVCGASGGCLHRPAGCAAGPCGDDPTCTFGDVAMAVGPRSPTDVTIQPGSSGVVAQLELRTGGVGGALTGLRVAITGGGSGLARLIVHEDADGDGLLDVDGTPVAVGEPAPLLDGILAVDGIGLALPPGTRRDVLLVLEPVPSAEGGVTARTSWSPPASGPWLLVAVIACAAAFGVRRRAVPRAGRFVWRSLAATALLCVGLGSLGLACGRTLLAGSYQGRVAIASATDVTVEAAAPAQLVVRGPPLEAARFRITLR